MLDVESNVSTERGTDGRFRWFSMAAQRRYAHRKRECRNMSSRQEQVVEEIQRRAVAGHSLKSGDNRGDWLYAAAVYHFGSWGKAVQAAGFAYNKIRTRPLTKTEVKRELRKLVKTGEPVLAKDHPELSRAAVRRFGSWWDALDAVGDKNPTATRWTKANVLAAIRQDIEAGLPVTSNEMRRRNENLYAAGRRRFGSWAAAVKAAKSKR
jgi:hypothetical protein